jgi:hypothetical protein
MRKSARKISCFALFLLCLAACQGERPLSPEEVVRQWQRHIDRNEFDQARDLSTSQARIFVDEVDNVTTTDTVGLVETELLGLTCQTYGDSAVCRYQFVFDGQNREDTVSLRRVKNRWLVDKVDFYKPPVSDTLQMGEENLIFPEDSTDEELE